MEEKSKKKLGLLTVLLFLAIIVIIIMGIFMNKIKNILFSSWYFY